MQHNKTTPDEPTTPDHLPSTFSWFSSSNGNGQHETQDSFRIASSVESVPLHRRIQEREECLSEFSVTPMTSRPHNCSFRSYTSPEAPPIRRVRSRSLGHVKDLQSSLPPLLLPPITVHTSTSTINGGADTFDSQPNVHDSENDKASSTEEEEPTNSVRISILYGMINATIVLPVLMSFTSIIYRDIAFAPFIPILVKLTLVSGIVHQLCFSTFSSLPFAVGQGTRLYMCSHP